MTNTFTGVCTLIGTIVGAGFLALPYVIMHSGLAPGLMQMLLLALAMVIVMLYFGEIILRTREKRQLVGYAEHYLGTWGKRVMAITFMIGVYAAALAYLIVQGNSLSVLLTGTTDYAFGAGILFWLAFSFITSLGIRAFKEGESIGVALMIIMLVTIVILTLPQIDVSNFSIVSSGNFFAPFGVLLFSFLGFTTLPELARILQNKAALKKTVIIAYSIVLCMYIVFVLVVLGAKGSQTPPIATLALGTPFILLSIITISGAYLALNISVQDSWILDFAKTNRISWMYTILIPIALYVLMTFLGLAQFTTVLAIGGTLSGGGTMLLILAMVEKAKLHGNRAPEYKMPYNAWILRFMAALIILGCLGELVSVLA